MLQGAIQKIKVAHFYGPQCISTFFTSHSTNTLSMFIVQVNKLLVLPYLITMHNLLIF